ncbi:LysM peptidoglycan-binding domain-containing protein [uncultured Kocuria sp.]|uniref:LysM peptidoglycan-binding domain-containing protein n=1 Tax=uncultured Kocuria sp. TaxID=259305 RepID=UPI00261D5E6D|nr:LysM domain-containing protein [uncultured Kocuria sp.]
MDGTARPARTAAAPLWSVLLVPALGLTTAVCGAVLTGPDVGRPAGGSDTGALIGLVAAAVGCALVVAWTLAAALAVLAVLADRRRWQRLAGLCRRCSPALLRRAAATALGLQLLAAPGAIADDTPSPFWDTGAAAQEAPAPDPRAPEQPSGSGASGTGADHDPRREPGLEPGLDPGVGPGPGLGGEPSPVPPAAPAPCGPRAPAPAVERTVDGAVTVVRGDTLWSLAAASLGPEASEEQIARAWPHWYELNRHVLVDGPHRLLPGQRLLVPGAGGP